MFLNNLVLYKCHHSVYTVQCLAFSPCIHQENPFTLIHRGLCQAFNYCIASMQFHCIPLSSQFSSGVIILTVLPAETLLVWSGQLFFMLEVKTDRLVWDLLQHLQCVNTGQLALQFLGRPLSGISHTFFCSISSVQHHLCPHCLPHPRYSESFHWTGALLFLLQ